MSFQIAYHTDVGKRKSTNQDALLIKTAQTPEGQVGLFAVCDGMGGLSQGELASATMIRALSEWFDQELPPLLESGAKKSEIVAKLEQWIVSTNNKIYRYGQENHIQLGTTITALLVIYSKYYLYQVGDSRAYLLENGVQQLTKDQTLVAREVERGTISKEQAKVDPRRNVLLQCIGATKELEVAITEGEVETGALFMLCTDGFYHKMTNNDWLKEFSPIHHITEMEMKEKAIKFVDLVKQRNETDNISVVLTLVK